MDKLSIRAYEGKLVGYAEEAKAYRICIPSLKKIIISRDVEFFEEMPIQEKKLIYIRILMTKSFKKNKFY